MREVLGGKLFDGGTERVHHFPKVQRYWEKEEGPPVWGEWWVGAPLSTSDKTIRVLRWLTYAARA